MAVNCLYIQQLYLHSAGCMSCAVRICLNTFIPTCVCDKEVAISYSLLTWLLQELYQWNSVAKAGRNALAMRYKLLPHLYTAFHQAHTEGTPVAKPLWFAYPSDPNTHAIDDQWLFGDVLISPVLHQV